MMKAAPPFKPARAGNFHAGVARMPMGKFIVYTLLGSYPWCLGLAWAGMKLGQAWHTDPRLKAIYQRFEIVIVIAVAVAVVGFVWHKVREARRSRGASGAAGA